jgi:polysaccharide biosynthesis protein PslG
MRRRTLGAALALLAACTLAACAVAAPARALTIGIADQKPDMFSDQRFLDAGIEHARLAVGWDALASPWQAAQLDTWLQAAHAAGVSPLVSFSHSRLNRRRLPTPERFLYEFRRFRARYPWVTDFATWNEANHCGEPTCHRPELVAAYYRKLRRACPTCRILAAEVLDMPNMTTWVRAFRRRSKVEPRFWGLHNYVDANRLRTSGTRRLLSATKGQIWFTETGGIVSRTNRRKVTFPESTAHAAIATRFLFDQLVPLSPRITRVYVYHWNSEPGPKTWDSALIGPTGKARPAYRVLERELTLEAARRILGRRR